MPVRSLNRLELERFVPKYVRLRQQLMNQIRQLQPGQSLPTIAVIRKTYKVSQPTVDRAIQELRSEGLLQSRRGSGVYVTDLARIMKVGIVFGHNVFEARFPAFEQALIRSLQKQSRKKNVLLRSYIDELDNDAQGPTQFHMDIASGRLDGLLSTKSPHSENLFAMGLPMIELGYADDNQQRVCLNYQPIVSLGVKALAARGCKSIGHFGHPQSSPICNEVEVFHQSVEKYHMQTRENWCCYWRDCSSLELVGYREFLRFWKKTRQKPDAIICTDDNVTSGIIVAARELGLKIGKDLHIASHANSGLSTFGDAPIIRIEFNVDLIAGIMLDALLDLISGKNELPERNVINPTLCK